MNNSSEKLGRPGQIVEIDEAKVGKRKYNRGRVIEVPNRTQDTLLRIIQDRILPGTTVMSDCWRAYDCLSSHDYEHLKEN
ncbi:hypothetical protein NQ318_007113 [Aromia moschata]|uniref:ISXO2-like transposase domain-containing protein n=1 Tax=Aromia moschata TaxID=1265417 RepID=A0AAV8X8F2_9CUCU|nr:hypothetical protein NQ318_007113 [Aromia moschata]